MASLRVLGAAPGWLVEVALVLPVGAGLLVLRGAGAATVHAHG